MSLLQSLRRPLNLSFNLHRTIVSVQPRRPFASTDKGGEAQDSKPGWEGRKGDDHALHRPALDPQAKESHEARKDHEQGKEGSQAISQKDERQSNKRAKEEHPEAPGPVLGMNDERGSKGH